MSPQNSYQIFDLHIKYLILVLSKIKFNWISVTSRYY